MSSALFSRVSRGLPSAARLSGSLSGAAPVASFGAARVSPGLMCVQNQVQPQRRSFHVIGGQQEAAALREDPTPLDVKFWEEGKPALASHHFEIDFAKLKGKYDLKQILSARDAEGQLMPDLDLHQTQELRAHMQEIFAKHGVVWLRNTGFTTSAEFNAATKVLHANHMAYEGGANLRAPLELEGNVYDTGAPKDADLQYHHEMAYVNQSPKWLGFGALEATWNPLSGATYVSLNNGATDMCMDSEFGRKLRDKGVCYIRKLPDWDHFHDKDGTPVRDTGIVYNYWQTSCGTSCPEEAQKVMEAKGLEIEWEESKVFGRYMVTKFHVDTMEYDPYSDRNTLYASVADDYAWFDSWPGVMDLPHWERPLKLTFGDGEVMTRDEKQFWVDCYDRNGVPILWEKGDLAIICNFRTAHGRPRYELKEGEKRELGVILGEVFDRQGSVEGKN